MSSTIPNLSLRISECMLSDQPRLRGRLRGLTDSRRREDEVAAALHDLEQAVQRSIDHRQRRLASRPVVSIPPELPIAAYRAELADAIASHQVIIVCGETGSGKTTQLPKICLEVGRGAGGLIGHTQPRRIAARSVAARIAHELHSPLGEVVGYKVRFQDRLEPNALIKVMTDGIMLAETAHDRNLLQYDTLIIDEAHERNLNIDFLLGYLKRLLPKRPDLKVVITSATIDPDRFSRHFGGAPIINVPGRTFPVEIRHQPVVADEPDEDDPTMLEAIAAATDELIAHDSGDSDAPPGDILVFLSGEREIREASEALSGRFAGSVEILPLYARLSNEEQSRIFEAHERRRIVLATNVAETSLTVPGIRYVIDPGLARISRYSPHTRVQRLPIERISQASADQRKGRCGRLGPGICVRLYSQDDFDERAAFTEPEVQRANLAAVILQMKALGLGEIDQFPFIDPPRSSSVREGYQTLHELGAIDVHAELTKVGRALAKMPVDPRLGRMILEAQQEGSLREVLIIAAALATQDPRLRPLDSAKLADVQHARFNDERSDFMSFIKLWDFFHESRGELSGSKLRRLCQQQFISYIRMREWIDVHAQLHALASESGMKVNPLPASYDAVHRAVLAGLLGNVGTRHDASTYLGVRDRKFSIFPGSGLFKNGPRWMMAAEVVETTKLYGRTVARIHPEWIERLAGHLLKRTFTPPYWNPVSAHVEAFERLTLQGLTIIPKRRVHFGRVDPELAREVFIQHALVEGDYRPTSGDAPFMIHNRQLIHDVRTLEAKSRRRDVMVPPEGLFAFYDQRVPPEVCNGPQFEKWRRLAERRDPAILLMSQHDLLRQDASLVTADQFPDHLAIDDATLVLPLEYHLDPGGEADGVTLRTPLEAINLLSAPRLEWLVPGLLKEKIVGLIKTLPKHLRVNFVPVPEVAANCLKRIVYGKGSLLPALGRALEELTGIEIPPDAWQPELLASHLRMNVAVVQPDGTVLAQSRDLASLRRQLAAQVAQQLEAIGQHAFERSVVTAWDFGDLPERIGLQTGSINVFGYPALVDEGTHAKLTVMDDPEKAQNVTRSGVRRLFVLQVENELAVHVEYLPQLDEMASLFAPLGSAAELQSGLIELIADRAFLGDDLPVRSQTEFERRLRSRWNELWSVASDMAGLVARILNAFHPIHLKLADADNPYWWPAITDIRSQLDHLLAPGFLVNTPAAWLPHLTRYLQAISSRLRRLSAGGLRRDHDATMEVAPHWQRWLSQEAENRLRGKHDPALEEFRWHVEELRVSLFAPELRAIVPVSSKRLMQMWERLG